MAGMKRLHRMLAGAGGPPLDARHSPTLDSSEQVFISSLPLLKVLKHCGLYSGRAGVPVEVMSLMLGEFVDEYTVRVVNVFAMRRSGTAVSVEAVDHVFHTNMLDILKQTGRPDMVVGWYHLHPGFGCWLSGVDIYTQQTMMFGQPQQTTSNLGHLNKPSIQASAQLGFLLWLSRHCYSIANNYKKNEPEEKMLLNLHKKKLTDGLTLQRFDTHSKTNELTVEEMLNLAIKYNKAVHEEDELSPEKLAIANVARCEEASRRTHIEPHNLKHCSHIRDNAGYCCALDFGGVISI